MLVAVIDNYDSFTFNLVHYIRETGAGVVVYRNDKASIDDLKVLNPDAIVISPGPGRPEDAGISLDVVKHFSGIVPLLDVCLGHQAIAKSFGGTIIQANQIMHGKTSTIISDGKQIYSGIKSPFTVMRYHSLAVSHENLPDCLLITARTEDGEIMGIRHKEHPTQGVQFHPESFMTDVGKKLIKNFINGDKKNCL
ncbi:MAG: aminodeoxychorismate/anthranilate synthase component II [Deltaproteobacteria bacterium]|uniref:anthranilate synthase component II n=1 Tax=Desulfobacula sp. TaxID=2593537 RepID=UPI0019CF4BDD|nr:aminodeoxychorismate/anthranilate synthase component II [Candidatus Desulfobacula maris]MBL6995323.1 aminodeoxychorismate/anthranilate synthase component II [Desulfobacula sp.]